MGVGKAGQIMLFYIDKVLNAKGATGKGTESKSE